jgi:chemotaxis protein MotB
MRRRHQEEPENHERWMVSYADFITLLLAFFVVMYSISSLNEGKYRIFSESLEGVFHQPDRSFQPITLGEEKPRAQALDGQALVNPAYESEAPDALEDISRRMREAFSGLIDAKHMTLRGNEHWIEIELSSGLLFASAEALPSDAAFGIVEKVAQILAPYENPVQVEGFTDNQPISTALFPSNWELSTARAASVVRLLAQDGVSPARLSAVGYGEFQPVADNATAQGRAKNRRVVLVVSRNLERRTSVGGKSAVEAGMQAAPQAMAAAPAASVVNFSSNAQ